MDLQEEIITKIRHLPEGLVQEVGDFVDFLLVKSDTARLESWARFREVRDMGEPGFHTYESDLQAYEDELAGSATGRW